jgi:hypothetical protein
MTQPKLRVAPEIFRGFWHGSPIGPYQLLCLRSFVRHGHRVEVFTYDDLNMPEWITRRDAREIFHANRILQYQSGFGRGSPALHSNLFRYVMLRKLGGWWVDIDVLLLEPKFPVSEFYFAQAAKDYMTVNTSVIKFPAGHPLLVDAVERCLALGENVSAWGQTGPTLLTELLEKHELLRFSRPWQTTYPVAWTDVIGLFDPARREEIASRCRGSIFLHLFNEIWRGAGIPGDLGPPAGSFLDLLFAENDLRTNFPARMNFENVTRWIMNRHDRIMLEEKYRLLVERYQLAEVEGRAVGSSKSISREPS